MLSVSAVTLSFASICPAEIMENNVVTVSLDHADEPVGTVIQIVLGREQRPAGYCAV